MFSKYSSQNALETATKKFFSKEIFYLISYYTPHIPLHDGTEVPPGTQFTVYIAVLNSVI